MGLATAALLPDGGAAASGGEFFRSPQFLAAEGATHTLRIESDERTALVPLIVRELEAPRIDAISPYAYPGGVVIGPGSAPAPDQVDWSATGLVSVFARERLAGEPRLGGARERSSAGCAPG